MRRHGDAEVRGRGGRGGGGRGRRRRLRRCRRGRRHPPQRTGLRTARRNTPSTRTRRAASAAPMRLHSAATSDGPVRVRGSADLEVAGPLLVLTFIHSDDAILLLADGVLLLLAHPLLRNVVIASLIRRLCPPHLPRLTVTAGILISAQHTDAEVHRQRVSGAVAGATRMREALRLFATCTARAIRFRDETRRVVLGLDSLIAQRDWERTRWAQRETAAEHNSSAQLGEGQHTLDDGARRRAGVRVFARCQVCRRCGR